MAEKSPKIKLFDTSYFLPVIALHSLGQILGELAVPVQNWEELVRVVIRLHDPSHGAISLLDRSTGG